MKRLLTSSLIFALIVALLSPQPVDATITSGSLIGITATFGSGGEVTLNSGGISIVSGDDYVNGYKFDDLHGLFQGSGGMVLDGGTDLYLSSTYLHLSSNAIVMPLLATASTQYLCLGTDGVVFASAGGC